MCGIFCSLRATSKQGIVTGYENTFRVISNKLKNANAARGPDSQSVKVINYPTRSLSRSSEFETEYTLELYASELRLRGDAPIVQPHSEGGDTLCWNGEVFEGLQIDPTENDGRKLFERLRATTGLSSISETIGNIEGPYAFVFYQASSETLYFARDPLGQRSLLIHKPTVASPVFLLSSVSIGDDGEHDFVELPTIGIYVLDLKTLGEPEDFMTGFYNSLAIIPRANGEHVPFGIVQKVNRSLPLDNGDLPGIQGFDDNPLPAPLLNAVEQLIMQLDKSVMLHVKDVPRNKGPRIAVLFSGGIDSTMLAFFAHQHVSLDEPIDLLNVAFENPRKVRLQLEGNIETLPKRKRKQYVQKMESDSNGNTDKKTSSYTVPDRETGLQEVKELRKLCPGRVWNFVEVDVSYEDSLAARSVVKAIMYPSKTVMDFSLALALYFASRGVGYICDASTLKRRAYSSTAKVVLSGLGSDELLGGYGRHRTIFTTKSWQGVIDELQLELDRIPMRNLGRDDRIISSHGKETRHPFLSLSVVSFLAGLPVYLKLDPRLETGIGDKLLLRLAARKVGLAEASTRKKRAMQFGSHSARMEGGEVDRKGDSEIL